MLPVLLSVLLPALLLVSGCGPSQEASVRVPPTTPTAPTDSSGSAAATTGTAGVAATSPALGVLHAWDARRSAAWRRADPAELAGLYVPGSRTGRADVRLLRQYADHGLVVRRLDTQVFAVRVLSRRPGRLVLRVTDRVAAGLAVRDGRPVALPATAPVVRVVTLERGPAGSARWRVREATRLRG